MKVKKDDKVLIVKGKSRGKVGKVLSVNPSLERVVVEGANIQKRHVRARSQGAKGSIVEVPGPMAVSNVKLICGKCDKATRVGWNIEGGEKYRACKKCGAAIA
ncbi:MAG: 50S ribosomal protein L24 [Candidatus Spechtbacterales bacterium]